MTPTETLTAAAHVAPPASLSLAGDSLKAVALRFPPRPAEDHWAATACARADILARLEQPPLRPADVRQHRARIRGARQTLQWLETFPGTTWQQRWNASPASTRPGNDWARLAPGWIGTAAGPSQRQALSGGLLSLICADVVRPAFPWLLSRASANMTSVRIGLVPARDPEAFAQLEVMIESATWPSKVGRDALHSLVKIVAAKGGSLADITVGDAVEYLAALKGANAKARGNTLFYAWLRELGTLPAEAPSSLRYLANTSGQVSMGAARRPVRCPLPPRPRSLGGLSQRAAAGSRLHLPVVKGNKRRKARMDHRTRERLPALPVVARAASSCLKEATVRLQALTDTPQEVSSLSRATPSGGQRRPARRGR